MGEIINLRQARKARNRAERQSRADENRHKHGRTKAEKNKTEMERERLDSTVDGARREKPEDKLE